MAGNGQPGPACGYTKPVNVNDGTMCRAESPPPGSVSSGVVATFFSKVDSTFSWVATSVGAEYNAVTTTLEVKVDSLQRGIRDDFTGALCIFQAYTQAQELAPEAILEETGCQLKSLIAGLIPGLLQMIAIVGASTLLGAGIGAAIGALAGGVGAAPGAVVGADLGFDLGMAALTWLGVAFLAVAIAKGFAELLEAIRNGVEWAWAARTLKGPAQKEQLDKAAHELARASGIVMRLVLQAILAYILKKAAMGSTRGVIGTVRGVQAQGAAAAAEASVAELVGKLRISRFGDGFADWVEKNWRDLQKNPKLQPKEAIVQETGEAAKVHSAESTQAPPKQSTPAADEEPATPADKPPDQPPATKGELNKSGLTSEQEAYYRKQIDNPPPGKTADDMRFERYQQRCANEGRDPLSRDDWQDAKDQIEANRERGLEQETQGRQALQDYYKDRYPNNIVNNNAGDVVQETVTDPVTGEDVTTRPDSIAKNADGQIDLVHDHKSVSGSEDVVYDTSQTRAQRELLQTDDGQQVITISSENPALDASPPVPRPSGPLANNSTVLYTENGQVTRLWVSDSDAPGGGYWKTP